MSILYVFLAILGLSVLIFVHELGHYFMARRVGMRVETFAIGFGKPIYSWTYKGVKWQIGWLLFGGYVKIAGQDPNDGRDPYTVPDGFFGKSPLARIKVALAGPAVNLIVAFLLFSLIWATGGRERHFADYTHIIGWVDPHSELYAAGLRPGDEIISYNGNAYQGSKDNLYMPMISPEGVDVKALKVHYIADGKTPFNEEVKPYPYPGALEKGILTTGILAPANYIIYNKLPNGRENPLPEGSPMQHSGIQYGDRIVWIDGSLVFSTQQLSHLLNDHRTLLTILRDGQRMLVRVPRVQIQELRLDPEEKEELTDWQYEAHLKNVKTPKLYTIPYDVSNNCTVKSELKFIDNDNEWEAFPAHPLASNEMPLLPNDKIIAVDGAPVKSCYQLLSMLQVHRVNVIVERNPVDEKRVSTTKADHSFFKEMNWNDIGAIADSLGTGRVIRSAGDYYLLNPIVPKMRSDFELSPERQAKLSAELMEQKKDIENIDDPERRAQVMALLKSQEEQLLLGLPGIQDRHVIYNPSPITQFENVFIEIWRTLVALVSGNLNPKWISGPIGIVQVVQTNWMVGMKEALFWLGAISLNLGILNLLPIPVLDGGTIMFSLVEMVTGRRLPPKAMEKLIIPFALMLILFFIFLTYQDISRLTHHFFRWW